MAVDWLRKVMGKDGEGSSSSGAFEIEAGNSEEQGCLNRFNWRWIITIVVSLQLLVFMILSLPIHGKHHHKESKNCCEALFVATFNLQRTATLIQNYSDDLERNMTSHFAHLNMTVEVLKVAPKPNFSGWAQVEFALYPEPSNRTLSTREFNKVRENLVTLFLQEKNLSLVPTTFGKVYDFQIDKLKGGITLVPKQRAAALTKRSALFNFTLHNATLKDVYSMSKQLNAQLKTGTCLHPNETLVARLTNLNGSTTEPPVIVQVGIFRNVGRHLGHHLPSQRLKQLARHISRHPKNLGLNRTMFGRVKNIQLAPVLERYVPHRHHAQAPGPAPTSSFRPGLTSSPYSYFRWHDEPVFEAPAPAPLNSMVSEGVRFEQESGFSDFSSHQGQRNSVSASNSSGTCVAELWKNMVLVAAVVFFFWF